MPSACRTMPSRDRRSSFALRSKSGSRAQIVAMQRQSLVIVAGFIAPLGNRKPAHAGLNGVYTMRRVDPPNPHTRRFAVFGRAPSPLARPFRTNTHAVALGAAPSRAPGGDETKPDFEHGRKRNCRPSPKGSVPLTRRNADRGSDRK
jgi:hypothetical protein